MIIGDCITMHPPASLFWICIKLQTFYLSLYFQLSPVLSDRIKKKSFFHSLGGADTAQHNGDVCSNVEAFLKHNGSKTCIV